MQNVILTPTEGWSFLDLSTKNTHTVKLLWLTQEVNHFYFSFTVGKQISQQSDWKIVLSWVKNQSSLVAVLASLCEGDLVSSTSSNGN